MLRVKLFSAPLTPNKQSVGLTHEWDEMGNFRVYWGKGDLRGRWWQMEQLKLGRVEVCEDAPGAGHPEEVGGWVGVGLSSPRGESGPLAPAADDGSSLLFSAGSPWCWGCTPTGCSCCFLLTLI